MGKTSLLNVWADRERHRGLQVMRAGCSEMESGCAFSVVRQLAEALLVRADEAGRKRLLTGPARLATRILEFGADMPSAELVPDGPVGVLHGMYWLMVHATDDGPVALVVDDVHWADLPSLRWLGYLTRRLHGLPLLLVLSGRSTTELPTEALLDDIAGHTDCHRMDLPAITVPSVARLIRASLGEDADEAFCAACGDAADGNPLLLRELTRTLRENQVQPIGDNIHLIDELRGRILATTVLKRLARQPAGTVALARALVVLGDGSRWDVAAAMSGLGRAETAEHARRLCQIGILESGDVLRFTHTLMRSMIAETVVTPEEAAAGHARAAMILHGDGAASDVVAAHLLMAEPTGESWRVDCLRDAARIAQARGAPDVGISYLRCAVRESFDPGHRGRVLAELGGQEALTDPPAAVSHLTQALAALTDPAERGQVASALAAALLIDRRIAQAVDVLVRAVDELGAAGPATTGHGRALSLRLEAQLVMVGYEHVPTVAIARQWAERLRGYDVPGDTPEERAVLAALAIPAMFGDASAAATNDLIDRALRDGMAVAGQVGLLFGLIGRGLMLTDRLDEAAVRFAQVAEMAGRHGSPRLASYATLGQTIVAGRRGQVLTTLAAGQAGLETMAPTADRVRLAFVEQVVKSLVEQEELDEATRLLQAHGDLDLPESSWHGPILLDRGRLHAARGEPHAALAMFLECGAHQQRARVTNPASTPWRSEAALAYAALGARAEALRLAEEELDLAHAWGTPRAIGVSLRALGVVTGGRPGLAFLRQAEATLAESPARLEQARASYELGAASCRAGVSETGRSNLLTAYRLAQGCGSRVLARRVRKALCTIGADPGPLPPAAPILSGSEHRVAALAVTGHTDRQIAQALMLTPHAVETLVAGACRRLRVSSRAELIATLAGVEQTDTIGTGPYDDGVILEPSPY